MTSWLRQLERNNVQQLEWREPSLSHEGIALGRIDLRQQANTGSLNVQVEQLRRYWRAFSLVPPFWQDIQLGGLVLARHSAAPAADAQPSDIQLDLPALATALSWPTFSLHIDEFSAELALCQRALRTHGAMQALCQQSTPQMPELRLNLQQDAQRLAWLTKRQGDVELLLMDCAMPQMDGFSATREIRAFAHQQHLPAVPVIALTALQLDDQRPLGLRVGMSDFLAKPIDSALLYRPLERHLHKPG